MKKVAIFGIIVGLGLGAYFLLRPSQLPENLSEDQILPSGIPEIVNKETDGVLSKVVPKDMQETKAYKAFVDSGFKAPFYLREAKLGAEEGREFLEKTFESLKNCYKEGCGQGPDEEGFYDPANTVAMVSMKRILEVALLDPQVLETNEWLQKDDLIDLLNAENSQVRKLALQNLMSLHKGEPGVFNEVLKQSENLKGYNAADTIEELLPYVNSDNQAQMVDSLAQIAKEKDGFTVTEVLERAENLRVTKPQIEEIGSELCRFSKVKTESGNFKAMNYTLEVMAKKSKINFSLKSYCR
jgi:hypothetical protein